jgi:hypothetical protein
LQEVPSLPEMYETVIKIDKKVASQANNSIRRSLGVDKLKKKVKKTIEPVAGKSFGKNS